MEKASLSTGMAKPRAQKEPPQSSGNSRGVCAAGAREGRGQSGGRDLAGVATTCVF